MQVYVYKPFIYSIFQGNFERYFPNSSKYVLDGVMFEFKNVEPNLNARLF